MTVAPTFRIVLRSAPGENMKRRPAGYSKAICLASFVRAAREAGPDAEIVYLNDGTMPEERAEIMRATGRVVAIPPDPSVKGRGGLIRSYRTAIDLHDALGWGPDDLVYLGEDDYLFRPEAFAALRDAAPATPAAYFALQGVVLDHRTDIRQVGDHLWMKAYATTSSIAAHVRTLRADRAVHHLGLLAGEDTNICQVLDGEKPYRWAGLVGGVLLGFPGETLSVRRRLGLALRRARMNGMAARRAFRPRGLFVPDVPLANHWEVPYRGHKPEAYDWEALAAETVAWAAAELGVHLGRDAGATVGS